MADRRRRNEAIRRRQEHYKPSQREDQERWEREEMRREERMRENLRTLRDAWEAYCKEQEQMRYRHRYCRCSRFGRSIPEWIESHNYALEERQSEEERRFLNQRYENMKDFLLRTLRGLLTLTDSVQRSELEKSLTEIMDVINDFSTIKTIRFAVFPNVNLHNFHCIRLSDKDLDVMFIAKRLEMKKIRLEAKKAQAEKAGIWNTVKGFVVGLSRQIRRLEAEISELMTEMSKYLLTDLEKNHLEIYSSGLWGPPMANVTAKEKETAEGERPGATAGTSGALSSPPVHMSD